MEGISGGGSNATHPASCTPCIPSPCRDDSCSSSSERGRLHQSICCLGNVESVFANSPTLGRWTSRPLRPEQRLQVSLSQWCGTTYDVLPAMARPVGSRCVTPHVTQRFTIQVCVLPVGRDSPLEQHQIHVCAHKVAIHFTVARWHASLGTHTAGVLLVSRLHSILQRFVGVDMCIDKADICSSPHCSHTGL